jgi:CheY-like chemotaxis protein
MESVMKIMVFDDSPIHRASAKAQLKGHDLTIAGTFDEAEDLLTPMKWGERNPCVKERNPNFKEFDVVMTDLMVPASKHNLGYDGLKLAGQEMPLGTMIAIRALAVGVKRVAIITDTNHHSHPAAAAFDDLSGFSVGDVKLFCNNYCVTSAFDEVTYEPLTIEMRNSEKYRGEKGIVYAKDWAKALATLLK